MWDDYLLYLAVYIMQTFVNSKLYNIVYKSKSFVLLYSFSLHLLCAECSDFNRDDVIISRVQYFDTP